MPDLDKTVVDAAVRLARSKILSNDLMNLREHGDALVVLAALSTSTAEAESASVSLHHLRGLEEAQAELKSILTR